jgi:sugar-specific transcriptional regulator TrmB
VQKQLHVSIGVGLLGQENLKNALRHFGATEKEAEVYIFLAKYGTIGIGQIARQMKINKGHVYRILSSLEQKGLVEATLESPTRFTAVPLEKVIDAYVKAKQVEISQVEKTKEDLLEDWKRISQTEVEPKPENFTVIEGNQKVYRKIAEMIEKTENEFSAITLVSDLARAEHFGVLDPVYLHPRKIKIQFRFLIDVNQQNLEAFKLLRAKLKPGLNIKARNPDLGLALFPRMVIKDKQEILLFISHRTQRSPAKPEICISTNCSSLVQSFIGVFANLWQNSTDIDDKIVQIETGKPTPTTLVIADEIKAREKYNQILRAAKKEIMLMTSAKELAQFNESTLPFKTLAKREVSVKILAPITIENMEQAKLLSKYCEIRHVPSTYLGTTIVDNKHLFQFKTSLSNQNRHGNVFSFKNAFYTTDSAFVEKTQNMLEDLWRRAFNLSKVKVDPIIMPHITIRSLDAEVDLERLPERLLRAGKAHEGRIGWGIYGTTIIKPPSHLNMPDIRILVSHFDEQCKLVGGMDHLSVELLLKSRDGEVWVPVAQVTDGGQEVLNFNKVEFAGFFAGENLISVEPEEIQVWSKGKTLFAGWTIPIPLLASKYVLEPGCIIFEAFGDEIHSTNPLPLPSGYLLGFEVDGFQAFTTFVGTSWKYSGPGISGFAGNFIVVTAKPESK